MTHTIPTFGSEQPVLPNQPFFSWLRTQTTLFIGQILALVGVVSSIASLIYYVYHVADEGEKHAAFSLTRLNLFIDLAHIISIVIFIVALIQVLDDNVRGSYRVGLVNDRVFKEELPESEHEDLLRKSKERLRRFKVCFLCFWFVMLALYVAFAFKHSLTLRQHTNANATQSSVEHLTNQQSPSTHETSAQTPQANLDQPGQLETTHQPPDLLKDKLFPFLTFALNNISMMFIFWCFAVLLLPPYRQQPDQEPDTDRQQTYLFWISGIVISAFTLSYLLLFLIYDNARLKDYQAGFNALSGVLNALVFALVIARLDSKLIGLPSWLISVLYSYAAVQPLFIVFEQEGQVFDSIQTAVLILVFISKIYFFLIIFYTVQTGRMLNYFYCFPFLNERVQEIQMIKSNKTGFFWIRQLRFPEKKWIFRFCIAFTVFMVLGSYIAYMRRPDGRTSVLLVITDGVNLLIGAAVIMLLRASKETRITRKALRENYFRLFQEPLEKSEASKLIRSAECETQKFKQYFVWFWFFVSLLYIVLLLRHADIWPPHYNDPQRHLFKAEVFAVVAPSFAEFALSTLNLMFIFWCFAVLFQPAHDDKPERRQKLVIRYSAFAVALLIAAFLLLLGSLGADRMTPGNLDIHKTVFNGVSGVLSVIALALLIARLDSKIISLSSFVVALLFTYAAIQALSVVFGLVKYQRIETIALFAGLLLKICFFLIVTYTLQTGKIFNYLVYFPFLHEGVDSIFANQFEIRTSKIESNLFTFTIWKSNKLIYSTESTFLCKEDCDESVETLRTLMKDGKRYQPASSCGTFWVQVFDENRYLRCESTALRSKEDAADLIHESREKIPYCKYER